MGNWIEMFRALGQALIEVIKAELAELGSELSRSGKNLGVGAGLFVAAAMFGFWTVAALGYFLIQLLALWLPMWGAALTVTGIFALLTAVLALVGLSRFKRADNPVDAVKRRFHDHGDWWQYHLLTPAEPPVEPLSSRDRKELV